MKVGKCVMSYAYVVVEVVVEGLVWTRRKLLYLKVCVSKVQIAQFSPNQNLHFTFFHL